MRWVRRFTSWTMGFNIYSSIGTSGRNAFRGPRFFNVDATLSKRFKVTETAGATFRLEAYNLFNNPNFGTPANRWGGSNRGGIHSH